MPYARNCLVLTLCLVLLADKPAAGQTAPQHRENGKPERVDKYGDALPEGAIVRLGTTRLRHEGEAHALAFSPDGKSLACADTRHRTTLWEVQSGKRSRALLTPYEVLTLAYSPDGKLLAAGGDHGQISVWDIATGARLSEFKVDRRRTLTSRVETLAFGPDGKVLYLQAESLNRSALIVAEAATGRRIRKLVERDALIWSFALSPDGERIAVPVSTGTIDILNTRTGGTACTIYSDWRGAKTPLRFSPDGKILAVGNSKGVALVDSATGMSVGSLQGTFERIVEMAFTKDGQTLLVGSSDGRICVWDCVRRKEQRHLDTQLRLTAVALSLDGKTAAAAGDASAIQLWDVSTGKRLLTNLDGHAKSVEAVTFFAGGDSLASGDWGQEIRLWDITGGEVRGRFRSPDGVGPVSFSPDGRRAATVSVSAEQLRLWDVVAGKQLATLPVGGEAGRKAAAFASDGATLVTANWPRLQRWDLRNGWLLRDRDLTKVFASRSPDTFFTDMFTMRLAVSADGKTVVLPKPGEASLCFVGLDTGRIESVVSPPVTAWLIAMSPDGRTLALADLRGDDSHPTICIWDVAASKEITLLSLPRRVVSALAFSADSRFIAAATDAPPEGLWDEETATIQLWDTATGRQVRRWQGHESRTASLAFARDGTRLAAGLDNGSILLWNLAGDLRVPLLKNTESSNAEIERRWGLLASQDAQEARRALWELSATPQRTLLFLQGRLVPAEAPEQAHLTRLICDLDDNDFSTRESAETKLKGLGELAVPALQGALARPPSLEARRRIERLLTQLTAPGLAGDRVRAVRAVEVLEHVGTPEACHLLQKMTKGVADARLTREAKAALERLGRRAQQ